MNTMKKIFLALTILAGISFVSCDPIEDDFDAPKSVTEETFDVTATTIFMNDENGAEYAEDRLDYLIVYSYKKDELYKTWGTPSENLLNTEADMWVLSETEQLIAYYDNNDEVEKIEILTVTAFD